MADRESERRKKISIKEALKAEKPARIQFVSCNPANFATNYKLHPGEFPDYVHAYGVHFLPPLPQPSVSSSNTLGVLSEIEMTTEMYAYGQNLRGFVPASQMNSIKNAAKELGIEVYESHLNETTICDGCKAIDTRIDNARKAKMRSHW